MSLVGATVWASLVAGSATAIERVPEPRAPEVVTVSESVLPPSTPSASSVPATGGDPLPDLTQSDPRLGLPLDGASHCGPVAVSNALVWLAEHGYPALLPHGATRDDRQIAAVRALAGRSYMATNPTGGTGTIGLLRGLERWVIDRGYRIAALEYAGWRAHHPRHATGRRVPDLPWLEQHLAAGGVAFLHVGWYRPPTRWELAYERRGGHWLTIARAVPSADAASRDAPSEVGELWLRDPAPYGGTTPSMEHVRVARLPSGWLLADGGRIAAKDALILGEGMLLKREEDLAIVDGAVVLRVSSPEVPVIQRQ
ncbi:MAG: hypothetical protein JW751_01000 [Polyangiaceae bacterium]|nr:hypothetical protein [Polyangiaceae bacterium]